MAYIDTDEYQNFAGNVDADGDSPGLIEDLVSKVEAIFEKATGFSFEVVADTARTFDSEADVDGRVLLLDESEYVPLAQITSITNGDGLAVAASSYVTEPRNTPPYHAIRLKASANVAWRADSNGDPEDAISIVGRWGWSVTPPGDVKHATIRMVQWFYKQKDTMNDVMQPRVSESGFVIMPQAWPKDVQKLMAPYLPKVI